MEPTPSLTDEALRATILNGLSAAGQLEARFRQPLERFLVGMCDRGDGRAQEKAVEIAAQTVADCFVKSPSLLERWHGGDNLEAFLRTAAANNLRSWWKSRDHDVTVDTDSRDIVNAPGGDSAVDREEIALAAKALRAGVMAAEKQCPEGVVFMRLKGLHGVNQRQIAQCWGHHEAQTGRRVADAMTLIRTVAAEFVRKEGDEFSFETLREALQGAPDILLGHGASGGMPEGEDLLLRVARGGVSKKDREAAVAVMCANASSLAFFARLLNREDATAAVVRDAGFAGVGARLAECLRRTLGLMEPTQVPELFTSLMHGCFSDMLAHVAADGGTLWWLCPARDALEAVYNPREPEILGKRQPLVSGIVSLVLGTGEPALVSSPADHARHSPAIDVALNKTTRSMIAVPFSVGGSVYGVVTAVRFSRASTFTPEDARIVSHHAEVFGELLACRLTGRILAD